jgi:small ligand-binding sensory domain FIST
MAGAATGLIFASAISDLESTREAVRQVVDRLARSLAAPLDLLVIFATPHHLEHLDAAQDDFMRCLSPQVLLGLTAEGVIGTGREIERQPGLAVLGASLPGATLERFSYEQIDWPAVLDSPQALRQTLGVRQESLEALLLLADPFSTPMTKLLPAMAASFPNVPIVGGMASAGRQPRANRLLVNGQVLREGAVGMAIGGDIRVHTTVSQGCRPIGKPFVITRSQRHVVQELGGQNAVQVLQQLVQDLTDEDRDLVQNHGLLVGRVINEYKPRFGRGDFLIRSVVGLDSEAGYFAIGDAQVRTGQTIQFHVRDQATAQEDMRLLLEGQKLHGDAGGALLFSCNGRGERLFGRPHADAGMIDEALGPVPMAGFFAAGEIGPIGGQTFVHGHTASLAVFRSPEPGPAACD